MSQQSKQFNNASRRNFLAQLIAAPFALNFSQDVLALKNPQFSSIAQQPPITMANAPHSRAFPFATLNSWITPTKDFFVRSHFSIPKIAPARWKLEISGAVERPRTFTFEEILKLPAVEQVVTLECSGNLVGYGGVSNGRWTGVRLATLLEACGVRADAIEAVLIGADGGSEREANDIQVPAFARAIPLTKALDKNTLLAYKMNGEMLPEAHGAPVRALIPGFYAMDSVKWLRQIVVSREAYRGFYHTERYYEARRINEKIYRAPLHDMRIKSQIARPLSNEKLALQALQIVGAAWTTGDAEITRVALSLNRGKSWTDARLGDDRAPFAWRLWSVDWMPEQAGVYEIIARAFDSREREQPMERDSTLITPYAQNHVERRIIEVG
ncbi:MAG: sulfite oxidase [Acidobacteriota bacterium]